MRHALHGLCVTPQNNLKICQVRTGNPVTLYKNFQIYGGNELVNVLCETTEYPEQNVDYNKIWMNDIMFISILSSNI